MEIGKRIRNRDMEICFGLMLMKNTMVSGKVTNKMGMEYIYG